MIRNRVKRRLRAAVHLSPPPPGWDLVVVARQPVLDADFPAIRRALDGLLGRLGTSPEARP